MVGSSDLILIEDLNCGCTDTWNLIKITSDRRTDEDGKSVGRNTRLFWVETLGLKKNKYINKVENYINNNKITIDVIDREEDEHI